MQSAAVDHGRRPAAHPSTPVARWRGARGRRRASTAPGCCGCGHGRRTVVHRHAAARPRRSPPVGEGACVAQTARPDDGVSPWQDLVEEQDGVLTPAAGAARRAERGPVAVAARRDRWQPLLPGVVVTHTGTGVRRGSRRGPPSSSPVRAPACPATRRSARARHAARRAARRCTSPSPRTRRRAPASWRCRTAGARAAAARSSGSADLRHPAADRHRRVRVAPAVLHAAGLGAERPGRGVADRRGGAAAASSCRRTCAARLAAMPRLRRRRLVGTVLDDVEHGAHAASELDFLRFLRRQRPARRRTGCSARSGSAGVRYLDAWWERQRVAVELDGAHHRSVAEWEADVLRANDVLVAGRQDGTVAAALHDRQPAARRRSASPRSSPPSLRRDAPRMSRIHSTLVLWMRTCRPGPTSRGCRRGAGRR